jgi:hypothetical protein
MFRSGCFGYRFLNKKSELARMRVFHIPGICLSLNLKKNQDQWVPYGQLLNGLFYVHVALQLVHKQTFHPYSIYMANNPGPEASFYLMEA